MAIISAGTSDEHVAEECRATADAMGCYSFRLADVSVDGLHRILHNLPGEATRLTNVLGATLCSAHVATPKRLPVLWHISLPEVTLALAVAQPCELRM